MSRYIRANIEEAIYKITADIKKYDEETQNRIKQAVRNGTKGVYENAVRAAPMKRTGNLKTGITMEMSDREATGVVKSTAPHSHLVEFGTKQRFVTPTIHKALKIKSQFVRGVITSGKMPKKPFMRPAIEKERPKIETAIKGALTP